MRRVGWDGAVVAAAALVVVAAALLWQPEGLGHWTAIVLGIDGVYLVWRARAP